uniref:Ig-like domain-containing protein n=1 Tax=Gopherus agassizii TaxID=38772 RepID=A0A452IZR4_9SAUR
VCMTMFTLLLAISLFRFACYVVISPSLPKVPPNIVGSEMPSEVSILLGESIQLVCEAKGIPRPAIQWLKDGNPVTSNESQRIRRVKIKSCVLSVCNLCKTDDTGSFTCIASNEAGEVSKHFSLKVLGKCYFYIQTR